MKYDNGHKGEERRKNGKVKFSIGDIIKIVVIAVAIVGGFIRTEMTVKANSRKLIEVKDVPTQMAVMQNDIQHIKQDIQETKDDIGEIKRNILKILEKL